MKDIKVHSMARPSGLRTLVSWKTLQHLRRKAPFSDVSTGGSRQSRGYRLAEGTGVKVSIGHSDATYEEAVRGFEAGITHATHTYNGMRGLHHREPGVLGAVLATPGIWTELIADLVHVHPGAIRVLLRCAGVEQIVLITDAVQATGLPDGEYTLGDHQIFVKDGAARLAEGNLAGSTLTMLQAVQNMIQEVGVSIPDAFRMASLNPAQSLGLADRAGSGKDSGQTL